MPPFVYSPHLSYWRSKDWRKLHPGFLRYWCKSSEFLDQLQGMAASTDMAPYLSLADQRRLKITIPDPVIQRTIAEILGALDDKIELNRGMNETLEAIARTIFADVTGSSKESCRVGDVSSINRSQLRSGDNIEFIDYVEISEVSHGDVGTIVRYERGSEPSRARGRVVHGDTVISTVRPDRGAYFLVLSPPESLVVSTGFAVITAKTIPWSYLYIALTQPEIFEELGRLADGGAYPAVKPDTIAALAIPKVSEHDESRFHETVAPILQKAEANRLESRTLAELRDTLLPKLLSDELRVRDAEKAVGERV